jgi:hypothetical protein
MRAVTALLIGIAAALVVGCEGVPDLRFAGPEDAATAPPLDATIGALDSSGGQSIPDATIAADVHEDDDAHQPSVDSALPPSDAAASCPNNPPAGVTCCGSIACKGTNAQCNCNQCQFCASEGVCCPSVHPPPGTCATKVSDCPP